jgi:hypothetical protein
MALPLIRNTQSKINHQELRLSTQFASIQPLRSKGRSGMDNAHMLCTLKTTQKAFYIIPMHQTRIGQKIEPNE